MGPKEKETRDIINDTAIALQEGANPERCMFILLCDIAVSLANICDNDLKGE